MGFNWLLMSGMMCAYDHKGWLGSGPVCAGAACDASSAI